MNGWRIFFQYSSDNDLFLKPSFDVLISRLRSDKERYFGSSTVLIPCNPLLIDIFSEGLSYFVDDQSLLEFGFLKKQILKTFDIDQEVLYAEIDFEALSEVAKKNHIEYKEIPRFPNSRRDFALLLDTSVKFDSIKEIAFKTEKSILSTVELFDV